jgi:hypothetical protein
MTWGSPALGSGPFASFAWRVRAAVVVALVTLIGIALLGPISTAMTYEYDRNEPSSPRLEANAADGSPDQALRRDPSIEEPRDFVMTSAPETTREASPVGTKLSALSSARLVLFLRTDPSAGGWSFRPSRRIHCLKGADTRIPSNCDFVLTDQPAELIGPMQARCATEQIERSSSSSGAAKSSPRCGRPAL